MAATVRVHLEAEATVQADDAGGPVVGVGGDYALDPADYREAAVDFGTRSGDLASGQLRARSLVDSLQPFNAAARCARACAGRVRTLRW